MPRQAHRSPAQLKAHARYMRRRLVILADAKVRYQTDPRHRARIKSVALAHYYENRPARLARQSATYDARHGRRTGPLSKARRRLASARSATQQMLTTPVRAERPNGTRRQAA
jgi:hypothetical protein